MGDDHVHPNEIRKDDITPSSSNPSNLAARDEGDDQGGVVDEKQDVLPHDRRDTAQTVEDEQKPADDGLDLQHHHTHQFGILKLRADDDDDPSDWWFASTAIPLIAATFAPMANVLSIAALVVPWRDVLTDTGPNFMEDAVGYPDPHWCIALNIASLVCGFVGNLFLLFNFTKRVRYIVALPATITLFYLSSGILIGITSSLAIHTPPGANAVYSQGFWHAVIAACLYMFNSMILMVNMVGYFLGHYPQHFTLTDDQRNLILQTMMFFIWLAGGAGVFANIEGWTYPDALYFCDVTILTIGFGDFFATNNLGRGLVLPFSVGGTIILGLMVSSIHRFAGELSKDNIMRRHVETRRVNTLSRAVTMNPEEEADEKRRAKLEEQMDFRPGHRPSISRPLTEQDMTDRKIGFAEAKRQRQASIAAEEPSSPPFLSSKFRRGPVRYTMHMLVKPVVQLRRATTRSQKALIMREEKDRFDAMRNIQQEASTFKKWYALAMSVMAFGTLWCVGAVVFWQVESETQGLSYFQALYFCYVSLLTIGYGDLSPKSNAGKPFFIVWSLIAVPTMTILISDMGDTVIKGFKQGTFKLADFTVLPKQGLYRDVMAANPWLWKWLQRRAEKKRIARGFEVGIADERGPPEPDPLPPMTIEQLAAEELNEAEMTKKLAFAIRKTADDFRHKGHHKYSYEEWVEFTRLIRFTKADGIKTLEHDEEQDGVVEWDWLDENSPMLSEQTEAEWVLDRLCESLLRLLKRNNLGVVDSHPSDGFGAVDFGGRSRRSAIDDGSVDPKAGPAGAGPAGTDPPATSASTAHPETARHARQRRAIGADAMLTFFTGERRGHNAYAVADAQWSKKGAAKQEERRKSSAGAVERRRGPFRKVLHHDGPKGAIGGGRGGAGTRTLKVKTMHADRTQSPARPDGQERARRMTSTM